ncbi:recombination protein RecR [Candidatus Bipolaricaulota bacterium]|nr:recombination protein RecR [Candidatus Bipolaricaulota bacterium]
MILPLQQLIDRLKALPGIGQKSAERVAFYLLNASQAEVDQFADAVHRIKSDVHRCRRCFNFATEEFCPLCRNPKRDQDAICVVAHPWEILKIEKTGEYHGLYHVLGGLVSPMDDVSPSDLTIDALVARVQSEPIREVILALEPRLDGELTGMQIASRLNPLGIEVTQIAQGVPVGRDLEFADEVTLGRALRGRTPVP